MQDIGKNIRRLRQSQNMTQDALAEALFVTRQTISNYENGVSRPDVEMLLRIAEVFGVDANTVLYGPPELLALQQARKRFLLRLAAFAAALLAYAATYPYAMQLQRHYFVMWAYLLRVGILPLLWFFGALLLMQALHLWAGLKPLGLPLLRRVLNLLLAAWVVLVVPMLLFYFIGTVMSIGQSSVSLHFPNIPVYTQLAGMTFRIAFTAPYLFGFLSIGHWLTGQAEE